MTKSIWDHPTIRTEAPSPNTRTLFCRSTVVLGRPRRTEPWRIQPQPYSNILTDGLLHEGTLASVRRSGRGVLIQFSCTLAERPEDRAAAVWGIRETLSKMGFGRSLREDHQMQSTL